MTLRLAPTRWGEADQRKVQWTFRPPNAAVSEQREDTRPERRASAALFESRLMRVMRCRAPAP